MSDPDQPDAPAPEPPPKPRRPWQPPRIQTGQLFETDSLMCLKAGPEPAECMTSPPESLKC